MVLVIFALPNLTGVTNISVARPICGDVGDMDAVYEIGDTGVWSSSNSAIAAVAYESYER
jgi:hypothetical protein